MSLSTDLHDRRNEAVSLGVGHITTVYADRAENAEIWDVEGKRYIDFAAGIAVVNTGHRHPKVLDAARKQLDHFTHACFHVTPYESYVSLAERLNGMVPVEGPAKTMFATTGAEAVENAVKVARAYTGRPGVVSFAGSFHGRTNLGMALTGKVVPYKKGFGPFVAEIYHVPFPNEYYGVSADDSLKALDNLFKCVVDPARIAAIIIEPVQGEGGFNVAPFSFLQELRNVCDTHGIVLIVDEVQTGFARTGKLFAIEHADIKADVVTMAKGLAGGMPLSAVTGRAEIMDAAPTGGLGGTYAGSPLGCSTASAVLDIIEEEDLCNRSIEIGEQITRRLDALSTRTNLNCIGNVRGLGAMCAIELVEDQTGQTPAPAITAATVKKAAEKGLIILSCGVNANVIRFLAPLTISDETLNEGLDIFEQALTEAVAENT